MVADPRRAAGRRLPPPAHLGLRASAASTPPPPATAPPPPAGGGAAPPAARLLRLARLGGLDLLDVDLGAADRVAHRLLALPGLLADRHLADHPGLLADLGLLAGARRLDRPALEGGLGLLGAELTVDVLALGLDLLLAQGHGLLDRHLAHAAGHPDPARGDLALADLELLLDHLHRLPAAGRGRG